MATSDGKSEWPAPEVTAPKKGRAKKSLAKEGREGAISTKTRQVLWARSAGVCAMPGCGAVLHRELMHFTDGCFGELAHNVAASARGPRGDSVRSAILVDDPDNLIMMCRSCHGTIDKGGASLYPEELLRAWKNEHEASVELLASITSHKTARILICTGNIRGVPSKIEEGTAVYATVKAGFKPIERPFSIELFDRGSTDGTPGWWDSQVHQLTRDIDQALYFFKRKESALAVFAVAEMPALVLLGYCLGDERMLLPFQFDRSTGSCDFANLKGPAVSFTSKFPNSLDGDEIALVIAVTAPIDLERIRKSRPGKNLSIVEICSAETGRQVVKSPATIEAFRRCVLAAIDQIEAMGSNKLPINVFPAMPAPLAVAFGATIMPKAPMRLSIFDSDGLEGIFTPAITLPLAELVAKK